MKRVPTRTPAAPAASIAATPARGRDPARGDHRDRDGVQGLLEQGQQRRALDALAPARLPALGDHDVAARGLGGARLLGGLDLPAADTADECHQRLVRLGEEEVDVRGALARELERAAVHHRHDEVHAERRLERVEDRARASPACGRARGTWRARPPGRPRSAVPARRTRRPSVPAGSGPHSATGRSAPRPRDPTRSSNRRAVDSGIPACTRSESSTVVEPRRAASNRARRTASRSDSAVRRER